MRNCSHTITIDKQFATRDLQTKTDTSIFTNQFKSRRTIRIKEGYFHSSAAYNSYIGNITFKNIVTELLFIKFIIDKKLIFRIQLEP